MVGKLLHKILSCRLEEYLKLNDVIDISVQKGFVTGLPGVFEQIYTLSAIMQDALTNKCPVMMTFLDLKNAFSSVPHGLMFNMLEAVTVVVEQLPGWNSRYHEFVEQLSQVVIGDSIPEDANQRRHHRHKPINLISLLWRLGKDLDSRHPDNIKQPE